MAELSDLPELVRQFRLETVINQTKTVHTLLRGQRRLPSRVTWERVTERPLGHGGYGEVWLEKRVDKVQDHTPGLRAVKSIYTNASSQRRDYVRELEALAKFSSNSHKYEPFFVQFHGWYESPGRLHAAMEYCEYGDLNKYIKSVGRLTEKETKDIIWQVLGGLSLMHEANFAHRDIKPANILIKSRPPAEWWVKLCDLGLSKRAEDNATATVMRGTPGFMAPEKLGLNSENTNGVEVDPFPADMWCLGETISHAVTGHGTFEPHASFYRYASGESDFPRASFRENSVSEECIDFIQSLMSPRPEDRLLASQALDHSWIAFEDESDSERISDVDGSPVTPCDGDEERQNTQASAAWTQETAKCTANSTHQGDVSLEESNDDDASVTMRMGTNRTFADTTVAAKGNGEKQLSDSGEDSEIEDEGERSAQPDEEDDAQLEEPSRNKSDSEELQPHRKKPTNTTYMEDADEDDNPIEGTKIYPGKRSQQLPITDNSGSRKGSFKRSETQFYSRTRSPSPVRPGQRTLRQPTQHREVYGRDGPAQHPVRTGPSSYAEFVVQSARASDQSAQDLDWLTSEYYPDAYDADPTRVWVADAFGNVYGLDERSKEAGRSKQAKSSKQVKFSDPHSDQDDQEIDTSVIDDTRPGDMEPGDALYDDAQYVDWGADVYRRTLRYNNCSDDDSNASGASNRRRSISEAWDQLQYWRNTPDNAAQYCPSVSTISIVDSEDEGTLPYALKRIQRDFPKEWKHHPLGKSYDEIDWHKHRLRLFARFSRGKRDPSVTISLPGRVRPILKGAETLMQGEESPWKKVRWDDDPTKARWDDDPLLGNVSRSLPTKRPHGNFGPLPSQDASDGEEERRRLRGNIVDRWRRGPSPRTGYDEILDVPLY